MPRPLSIGARWALSYMAVMVITASAFSFYVYSRVEDRIREDARLVLELQLTEMLGIVDSYPDDPALWRRYVDRQIEAAGKELQLGIQLFDAEGERHVSAGSATDVARDLPKALRNGKRQRVMSELEKENEYPFLTLAGRAEHGYAMTYVYAEPFARNAEKIQDAFLGALPVLLVLTAALGWGLSRRSLRPISAITRTVKRISSTRLDERIPTTGSGDELDELANTLNEVLGRIREGVERVRRFSADAAHQLRTPLTALQSQIEVTLAKDRPPGEYRQVLSGLLDQVMLLSDTVNGMLRLAHSEGGIDGAHRVPVEMDPLLREVVEFFEAVAEERDVALVLGECEEAQVEGDPVWLHQLFANLVHNALRYTKPGGRVQIDARCDRGEFRVIVRDTGVGMSEDETEQVFERFARGSTEADEAGLGIGLTLAREIARAHGGSIEVESRPNRGSTFAVRLPLVEAETPKKPPKAVGGAGAAAE